MMVKLISTIGFLLLFLGAPSVQSNEYCQVKVKKQIASDSSRPDISTNLVRFYGLLKANHVTEFNSGEKISKEHEAIEMRYDFVPLNDDAEKLLDFAAQKNLTVCLVGTVGGSTFFVKKATVSSSN